MNKRRQSACGSFTWRGLFAMMVLAIWGVTGCTTASRYERPEMELPDTWINASSTDGGVIDALPLRRWWNAFQDEELTALLKKGVTDNLDLQTAAKRIDEALALRGIAAGALLPVVSGTGTAQFARLSDIEGGAALDSRSSETYRAGFDASWEIDLWGRIGESVLAADAAVAASAEDYRDTLIVLKSEIAHQYFVVRELHHRTDLLHSNILAQKEIVQVTRNRYAYGLSPELDVHQAELNLASTQSALPPLQSQLVNAVNSLAVLTGQLPGAVDLSPKATPSNFMPSAELDTGLPADLLRNRPDVRRAEKQLIGQTARLGVARKDLLPRLSLSGTFATQASDIGDLGSSGSQSYRFGPSIHVPLFQGGRLRSAVAAEQARLDQSVLQYRQTILRALEEVENAMATYHAERNRLALLRQSVASAERSVDQVFVLYDSGLVPFLNVLDAQRSLVQQHDLLAQSMGQVQRNVVSIYRALGGDWQSAMAENVIAEEVHGVEADRP
jgi:outer membrane protein, multidrug efflux system